MAPPVGGDRPTSDPHAATTRNNPLGIPLHNARWVRRPRHCRDLLDAPASMSTDVTPRRCPGGSRGQVRAKTSQKRTAPAKLARAGTRLKFSCSETPSELREVTFGRDEWGRTSREKKEEKHTQKLALHSKSDRGYLTWHALLTAQKLYIRVYAKKRKIVYLCVYIGAPPTRRRRFPLCHPSSTDAGLFFQSFPNVYLLFWNKKKKIQDSERCPLGLQW